MVPPRDGEGEDRRHWNSQLIALNNQLTRMEFNIEILKSDNLEMKKEISDLREENLRTMLIFERGRTAVYILGAAGTVVGFMIIFAKDVLLRLWGK